MADDSNLEFGSTLLAFNGINGATGEYGIEEMTEEAFVKRLQFDFEFEGVGQAGEVTAPVGEGITPTDLAQAGWGIIFADKDPKVPEIKKALSPLLNLRREQATQKNESLFKIFEGTDGYRPRESKRDFLGRYDVGTGPVYPEEGVPYYLLLVGSPEQIPFNFQFQLNVQYCVGRIYFEEIEEYANYARSVVAAETGQVKLPRKVSLFGVENRQDRATQMSSRHLVAPLYEVLKTDYPTWEIAHLTGQQTKKQHLIQLLGGAEKVPLLFTASHGMEFPLGDARQITHQGALLCQDWPGPRRHRGPIPESFYFAGDDLEPEANLLGMVAFAFACFGAGCPRLDEFTKQSGKAREPIAERNFLAALPTKMLSHPNGGALAFIGHVERAWGYSFLSQEAGANISMFRDTLSSLMAGDPVGFAADSINLRYAEIATDYTDLYQETQNLKYLTGEDLDELLAKAGKELTNLWTEHNDARDYIIIGDPAVRLPLVQEGEEAIEHPALASIQIPQIPQIPEAFAPQIPSAQAEPTETTEAAEPLEAMAAAAPDQSEITAADLEESAGVLDIFSDTKSNVSEALQQFVDSIGTFLKDALQDAAKLEISTYTSNNMSQVEYKAGKFTGPAEMRVQTIIELDGDVSVCVPVTEDGEIDAELWDIHLQMVKEAQAGRNELVKTAVSAATGLLNLWKPG